MRLWPYFAAKFVDLPFFSVVKRLFDVAIRTVFGCESSQMSVFFLLYYAALAGGFNELLDTKKGTAQEFRVKVRCLLGVTTFCF